MGRNFFILEHSQLLGIFFKLLDNSLNFKKCLRMVSHNKEKSHTHLTPQPLLFRCFQDPADLCTFRSHLTWTCDRGNQSLATKVTDYSHLATAVTCLYQDAMGDVACYVFKSTFMRRIWISVSENEAPTAIRIILRN